MTYPDELNDYELKLAIEFYESPAGRQARQQMPCGDQDQAGDYHDACIKELAHRQTPDYIAARIVNEVIWDMYLNPNTPTNTAVWALMEYKHYMK